MKFSTTYWGQHNHSTKGITINGDEHQCEWQIQVQLGGIGEDSYIVVALFLMSDLTPIVQKISFNTWAVAAEMAYEWLVDKTPYLLSTNQIAKEDVITNLKFGK